MTPDSYNSKTDIPQRYRSIAGLASYEGNQPVKSAYREISNIRRTKSQNLNVARLALQLSLCKLLKSGVKTRMKM